MGKGGLISLIAAGMALAACSSAPPAPVAPPPPAAPPPLAAPAPEVLDYAEQTQPIGSRMPMDGDLCRASENQDLIGKPRTEIPVPVDVINRRVTCTTCAITEDYSPYRLNIFFNRQTGLVEEVRCG